MRLEVTKKCDLAMEALHVLSKSDARIKGPQLATEVGTTSGFLSQALTPLVKRGIVISDPGPNGGYSLGRGIDKISVLEIIESLEGPTVSGVCVLAEQPCNENSHCALHHSWLKARTQLLKELDKTSVAESLAGGS